jgi:hypothetical protein
MCLIKCHANKNKQNKNIEQKQTVQWSKYSCNLKYSMSHFGTQIICNNGFQNVMLKSQSSQISSSSSTVSQMSYWEPQGSDGFNIGSQVQFYFSRLFIAEKIFILQSNLPWCATHRT